MFYEAIGPILLRAAQTLGSEVRPQLEGEEYLLAQVDAVRAFVGELGAMWPHLVPTLQREHDIYWAAIGALTPGAAPTSEQRADLVRSLSDAHRLVAELLEGLPRDRAGDDLAVLRNA